VSPDAAVADGPVAPIDARQTPDAADCGVVAQPIFIPTTPATVISSGEFDIDGLQTWVSCTSVPWALVEVAGEDVVAFGCGRRFKLRFDGTVVDVRDVPDPVVPGARAQMWMGARIGTRYGLIVVDGTSNPASWLCTTDVEVTPGLSTCTALSGSTWEIVVDGERFLVRYDTYDGVRTEAAWYTTKGALDEKRVLLAADHVSGRFAVLPEAKIDFAQWKDCAGDAGPCVSTNLQAYNTHLDPDSRRPIRLFGPGQWVGPYRGTQVGDRLVLRAKRTCAGNPDDQEQVVVILDRRGDLVELRRAPERLSLDSGAVLVDGNRFLLVRGANGGPQDWRVHAIDGVGRLITSAVVTNPDSTDYIYASGLGVVGPNDYLALYLAGPDGVLRLHWVRFSLPGLE
jgi:hypothetical protein